VLSVEGLYADMMKRAGLRNVAVHRIRKRNSKKELYEYVVAGTHGARKTHAVVFEQHSRRVAVQATLGL